MLAHERAGRDAPDFLPKLQKELIDVVGRYVQIRDDMIRVNLGKSGETSLLGNQHRDRRRQAARPAARRAGRPPGVSRLEPRNHRCAHRPVRFTWDPEKNRANVRTARHCVFGCRPNF